MITLVLADDEPVVRSALRALFEDDERFSVVGEAEDAAGCVELVLAHDPDVVLLDVRMPGGGLWAAQQLRTWAARSVVVVLSARLDPVLLARLLAVGVTGAFDKGAVGSGFPDLISRCVAGERVLQAAAAEEALRMHENFG